jgi:hypothetical protein
MIDILGSPASSFMQEELAFTGNLLSEYQEIIATYLLGLSKKLDIDFRFTVDTEKGEVRFRRNIPNLPVCCPLAITYKIDQETLDLVEPSAEALKVLLASLENCITTTMMQLSDQFFQDRYDGKPFPPNEILQVDGDGKLQSVPLSDINWLDFFLQAGVFSNAQT